MDSDYGVPRELSEVQKKRALYQPEVPPCLQGTTVRVEYGDAAIAADPAGAHVISQAFPHTYGQPLAHFLRKTAVVPDAKVISEHPAVRVGIVFCGRQSPGGHNVVWGLYEAIKAHNQNSKLIGFLGGSDGLLAQKTLEITDEVLSSYKNQGGYDMLGRTKDQIRTTEQVNGAMASCKALKLDALVNSQLISNMCTDALSAEKYYYFIRLMGRKASHVALECALQSHPNMEIHGLHGKGVSAENISSQLSPWASALFEFLPPFIRKQLLLHPESDDSAQLSQIETEKLLAQLVETEMNRRLVKSIVKPGCSQDVLKAALSAMSSVTETLNIMISSSNGQTPL
nr:unnamed protein product [Digitaria exilis]